MINQNRHRHYQQDLGDSNENEAMEDAITAADVAADAILGEINLEIKARPAARNEEWMDKCLRKKTFGTLEKLKGKLNKARKPSMRMVSHYQCDECDKTITNPAEGFIVQGNIYTADSQSPGGLIGDNFPETETFKKEDVRKHVYCVQCFLGNLGMVPLKSENKRASQSDYISPRRNRTNPFIDEGPHESDEVQEGGMAAMASRAEGPPYNRVTENYGPTGEDRPDGYVGLTPQVNEDNFLQELRDQERYLVRDS